MIKTLDEATRLLKAAQLMLLGKDNQPISDLYYALQIAVDSIEELKERREANKWITIDTEKDLPKEDGFYLTTVEYEESISGKLKRNTAELYFSSVFKRWSECGEDEDSEDDVIAWRPMPKPYGSEAENEQT